MLKSECIVSSGCFAGQQPWLRCPYPKTAVAVQQPPSGEQTPMVQTCCCQQPGNPLCHSPSSKLITIRQRSTETVSVSIHKIHRKGTMLTVLGSFFYLYHDIRSVIQQEMVQNRAHIHDGKGHFVTDEVSMHRPDAIYFDTTSWYLHWSLNAPKCFK